MPLRLHELINRSCSIRSLLNLTPPRPLFLFFSYPSTSHPPTTPSQKFAIATFHPQSPHCRPQQVDLILNSSTPPRVSPALDFAEIYAIPFSRLHTDLTTSTTSRSPSRRAPTTTATPTSPCVIRSRAQPDPYSQSDLTQ